MTLEDILSLLDKNRTKIPYATKLKKPKLYSKLEEFSKLRGESPVETCWLILHNESHKNCIICGKKALFLGMKHGYHSTCSNECAYELKKIKSSKQLSIAWSERKEEILLKRSKTCITRFGTEHALQAEVVKNKSRKTSKEKYGVDHHMKARSVQIKAIKSKIEKYGSYSAIGKKGNSARIKTNRKKYGVDNVCQYIDIKEKLKRRIMTQDTKDKIRKTKESRGTWLPLSQKSKYEKYRHFVWKETNKNIHLLNFDKLKRGRAKTGKDNFQIDHKFSIIEGFKKNVPPEIIGHIANLDFIHWKDNIQKRRKCSITLKELYRLTLPSP